MSRTWLRSLALHLPLTLLSGLALVPVWWMVMTALEPMRLVLAPGVHLWPAGFQWGNFIRAWRSEPFGRYYLNSLGVTAAIVLLQVTTSALAAYALVFLRFRGRRVVWAAILLAMMVPIQAVFIPDYLILRALGWINSYAALVFPFTGSAFGVFWLAQAFRTFPRDLVQAMALDGAGPWRIWWHLILPNHRPALWTLAVVNGVFHYGYLFWPLLVTDSNAYRVLPLGLSYFVAEQSGLMAWNLMMAAAVFTVLPMVLLFVIGQRYLRPQVTSYGLKD